MAANASSGKVLGKKDFRVLDTVVDATLPKSTGANFHDDPITRTNLRKSHTLGAAGVAPIRCLAHGLGGQSATETSASSPSMLATYHSPAQQAYQWETTNKFLHGRKTLDLTSEALSDQTNDTTTSPDSSTETNGPVLKFLGYIREAIPESPDERIRIRKVGVSYFLLDNTIAVREAHAVNSGMSHGTILSRQRVARDGVPTTNPAEASSKATLTLDDFALGKSVRIYAFEVCLLDMDDRTRSYFRDVLHRPHVDVVARPWPAEDDVHGHHVQLNLSRSARRLLPTTDYDYKRALESMTGGGRITKHAPDDVRSAQQFLRNSINEHFSFLALWDDRKHISGDLRRVVIRYYLENDAVEIVEQRDENCGREGGAKLLCRQRVIAPGLPTPPSHVGGPLQQNTYGLLVKREFLNAQDFYPLGKYVRIYEHDYLVYDADAFTKSWFRREYQLDLGNAVDVSEIVNRGSKPLPVQYPPPHLSGIGTEEDSLQSWKSLVVKTLKQDIVKLAREEGKCMVFSAIFTPSSNMSPQDEGRQFVIRFHRATDEVDVFERQIRNSGIVGGKFLSKARHLKPLPDGRKVPFTPADFTIGNDVMIVGHSFRLVELDELSRLQCLEGDSPDGRENPLLRVTEDRVKQLIVSLKDLLNSKYRRLHEAFRAVAPDGLLTVKQLREFFDKCSGPISEAEAVCIIEHFANNNKSSSTNSASGGGAVVTFSRFVDMMALNNEASMDATSNSIRAVTLSPASLALVQKSAESDVARRNAMDRSRLADDAARYRALKKLLLSKLESRRAYLLEVFRLLSSAAANARLTARQFKHNLVDVLQLNVTEEDKDAIVKMLFASEADELAGIPFRTFYEFVDPTLQN